MDGLSPGNVVHLGQVLTKSGWREAAGPEHQRRLMAHLAHVANCTLQMPDVASVKLGRGCPATTSTKGHTRALLMWWAGPQGEITFTEIYSLDGRELASVSLRKEHPNSWQ